MTTRTHVPEANRAVVEGGLRSALRYVEQKRGRVGAQVGGEHVLLLRAAPEWHGPDTVQITVADQPVSATVRSCATVLAVLDAMSSPYDTDYLVILTGCDTEELGETVRSRILRNSVMPINRWDLVADAFGARRLDPQFNGHGWLAEALLNAQPGTGWRRINGTVLRLETALQKLASVRFSLDEGDQLDASSLLEWTRDLNHVSRFLKLDKAERDGLASWLEQSVGPVASIIFRLIRRHPASEAIPFGLAAAELYAPSVKRRAAVTTARVRAEERFLDGETLSDAGLLAYAEAAESLVLRWSENGHTPEAEAACERAEELLAALGAAELSASSKLLGGGLNARLRAVAAAISAQDLGRAETALAHLLEHRRPGRRRQEVQAAVSAVRLMRWLECGGEPPATVAAGVKGQIREWGWVDRAHRMLFDPDTSRVPEAKQAYQELYERVRTRRAIFDRAFAERLAAWSSGPTSELLLAENLLERVARPVAEKAAPLIIVLDGMSAAVACVLAEEITATRSWVEIGRSAEGREGALATVPSVTAFSRTSLLCGALHSGTQREEQVGFKTFWKGRSSVLFHKAGLGTGPGAVLSDEVESAIRDQSTVVGVVLNTIDDALKTGHRISDPTWTVPEVDYLKELLESAWTVDRPVILTSDHGHVLDQNEDITAAKGDAARYRSGDAEEGEVAMSGERVLLPGGHVVVPWDERIRYQPRKAGYHGGVSLAEMVIPVVVLIKDASRRPRDWFSYDRPSLHEPTWWNESITAPESTPVAAVAVTRQPQEALFPAGPSEGLGAQIVQSPLFESQSAFVRKAPPAEQVAALIDALTAAGGRLPATTAAQVLGQPTFRLSGYLSQIGRLLNVDGYQVIAEGDGGRTVELKADLLRLQFLGES